VPVVVSDKILITKFFTKEEEVTGGWRKLRNKELHNMYFSHHIVTVIN
jgi:hypothetical protein